MDPKILAALAFTAGFIDTVTFFGAGGLFSAHVTGNFVLFAAALVRGLNQTDILKLLALPFFATSVAIATVLKRSILEKKGYGLRTILHIEAGVLVACGLAFAIAKPQQMSFVYQALLMLVVASMGFQNAYHRFFKGPMTASTVMTGNVTQLTMEFTEQSMGIKKSHAPLESAQKAREILTGIVGFAVGCLCAAISTKHLGLASISMGGIVLLVACLLFKKSLQ